MGIEWCRVLSTFVFAQAATIVRQGAKPVSVPLALIVCTPMVRTHRHGFSQTPQVRR